jgi:hypothetical protein
MIQFVLEEDESKESFEEMKKNQRTNFQIGWIFVYLRFIHLIGIILIVGVGSKNGFLFIDWTRRHRMFQNIGRFILQNHQVFNPIDKNSQITFIGGCLSFSSFNS